MCTRWVGVNILRWHVKDPLFPVVSRSVRKILAHPKGVTGSRRHRDRIILDSLRLCVSMAFWNQERLLNARIAGC